MVAGVGGEIGLSVVRDLGTSVRELLELVIFDGDCFE
jgi:hypothetical protein